MLINVYFVCVEPEVEAMYIYRLQRTMTDIQRRLRGLQEDIDSLENEERLLAD